jgi:hypothetical protein
LDGQQSIIDGAIAMGRKKGDLPGRFVNAYLRKNPHQRGEYVNVAEYQERVEVNPSKLELVDPQGKFELSVDLESEAEVEELAGENKGPDDKLG